MAKKKPAAGVIGPKMRELAQVALAAKWLETTVQVEDPARQILLSLDVRMYGGVPYIDAHHEVTTGKQTGYLQILGTSPEQGLADLAKLYAGLPPKFDTVTAKATKASLKLPELRELAIAAWAEAFGVAPPTAEELADLQRQEKAKSAQLRDVLLQELRGGPGGVKKWNARTLAERQSAGPYRKVDLSGQALAKADLGALDFAGACFDGADLTAAELNVADVKKASFRGATLEKAYIAYAKLAGADLTNASLAGCDLRGIRWLAKVNLAGADLSHANLSHVDLRGVDLSTAKLNDTAIYQARFDEQTRFPPGFTIPESLIWAGTGTDPRRPLLPLASSQPGTLSFDDFMDRLRGEVSSASLDKALKMLQAERFQLFSEAKADGFVGVVKSQSSADLVYACRLAADGTFACCTQNLNRCGGLNAGSLCKHLLVLVVGLTKSAAVDPVSVDAWVKASCKKGYQLDKEQMTATFLRYKGAEAGELDWRPTETIPEDYYAL